MEPCFTICYIKISTRNYCPTNVHCVHLVSRAHSKIENFHNQMTSFLTQNGHTLFIQKVDRASLVQKWSNMMKFFASHTMPRWFHQTIYCYCNFWAIMPRSSDNFKNFYDRRTSFSGWKMYITFSEWKMKRPSRFKKWSHMIMRLFFNIVFFVWCKGDCMNVNSCHSGYQISMFKSCSVYPIYISFVFFVLIFITMSRLF